MFSGEVFEELGEALIAFVLFEAGRLRHGASALVFILTQARSASDGTNTTQARSASDGTNTTQARSASDGTMLPSRRWRSGLVSFGLEQGTQAAQGP